MRQLEKEFNAKSRRGIQKFGAWKTCSAGYYIRVWGFQMKIIQFIALAAGILAGTFSGLAQTWTQSNAPTNNWFATGSSADGMRLIASGNFGAIYLSTNYGAAWFVASNAPVDRNWARVAANSATGNTLAAADFISGIWLSHDFGATWSLQDIPDEGGWTAVAMSKDGNKIIAGRAFDAVAFAASDPPGPGLIYISGDSGVTWVTNNLPAQNWVSVASSADGHVLMAAARVYEIILGTPVAIDYPGPIFVSTNFGSTWLTNNVPLEKWYSIQASADGSQLLAGTAAGLIYSSTDYGLNWSTNNPGSETNGCSALALSADGAKWLAAYPDGNIFYSTNQGAFWFNEASPTHSWSGMCMSADGNRLTGVVGNGGIFTAYSDPSPTLGLRSFTTSS